jgi:hypothetical protein
VPRTKRSKFSVSKSGVSIPHGVRSAGTARAKSLGISYSLYLTILQSNDLADPSRPLILAPQKPLTAEDVRRYLEGG